ncbi:Inner membrane protein YrbG [Methanimicrococcus sp. At1]|uniref:Inner membrane protein YrbG n=1 Tax=Methanimicrococcus hacksteinii TaxID=3028293 RepID=A0ABU3VQ11_9EURY|nr:calcium/sodium antiporter [Methanimicrococcus sp. At1]MDV0445498.1 Inner membrane protein YrbG [Methanimicrococcus sp. At1]
MTIDGLLIYVLFIIGLALIGFGAGWFVDAAVNISKRYGIPKAVIGATIVSFATTAPEFLVSFMAALNGQADMAIGNAVGSTICNIGIAIGFIVMLKTVAVDDKSFNVKALMMLASGAVLFFLSWNGVITKMDGIILLVIFVAYMAYTYWDQKKEPKKPEDDAPVPRKGIWAKIKIKDSYLDVLMFLVGAVFVVGGSRLVVTNGTEIATQLGIPELIISLTLISIGTSLPEIITAITSYRKGFQDLSIGNIVGANILDITMILGVSSMFVDLTVNSQLLRYDYIFMMLLFVLVAFFGYRKKITRWQGAIIALVYVVYLAGLILTMA